MHRLRLLLLARPFAALWLVACVLAVRMLVPAGFMPVATAGGVVLGLCPGTAPVIADDRHAMIRMHHGGGKHRDTLAADTAGPCAFAGIGAVAFDLPVLALAAIAFAVAPPRRIAGARSIAPTGQMRWRPPLRAPPVG